MKGSPRGFLLDTNVLSMLSSRTSRISSAVLDGNIPFEASLTQHEMRELPVSARYTETLRTPDCIHRDPFDRMLVAQAITDKLTLVTSDRPVSILQV